MTKGVDPPQPRKMTLSDLDQIAGLHRDCFPESISIFSALSDDVIKQFYKQALEESECTVTVLEETDSGRIIGLAFGTTRPGFQGRFLRNHFLLFCWSLFKGLFVSKAVWKLVWLRLRKKTGPSLTEYDSDLADAGVPAPTGQEGLFVLVGVHPEWRGGGNAERLVKYFTTQMFEAGAARIRGAIRSDNLPSLILHKRLGWHIKKISADSISVWIDRSDFNS